ncbi:hypothetical protein CEF21_05505 [Bacillus sp. FJAT-42376]|uniref:hypothetical protein n=1 Tax=Bacillus sp. FJAT-42376 TaxID=2014076 RepID=UPI000F4D634C|nr:hypothetical protein [Bacillus sp. FJAT-42376]AZB41804.1 hypothetical protein CEF21_05505 [Bacillus sp. FJAT-42376]
MGNFIKILICSALIILSGCNSNEHQGVKTTTKIHAEKKKPELISYDRYQSLLNDLGKSIKVEGFQFKGASTDTQVTIVGKKQSFGKREFLTIGGKMDGKETNERVFFENNNTNVVTSLDLIYLEKPMDNDMLYWNQSVPYGLKNKEVLSSFDESMLVYKNIIFKITVLNLNDKTNDEPIAVIFTEKLVDFINTNLK